MSDYSELERRAQAVIDAIGTLSRARQEREFNDVCTPQVVLAQLADLDEARSGMKYSCAIRLKKQIEHLEGERDRLRAENERLNAENKQLILLECNGGTAQAAVNLLTERDQLKAELEKAQLIGRLAYNFDGYKAVLYERDQLRAEVAGLNTGYEAYERVNAELKAKCEAACKDAERYRWLMSSAVWNGTLGIEDGWINFEFKDEAQEQIDAAMGKGEQS